MIVARCARSEMMYIIGNTIRVVNEGMKKISQRVSLNQKAIYSRPVKKNHGGKVGVSLAEVDVERTR